MRLTRPAVLFVLAALVAQAGLAQDLVRDADLRMYPEDVSYDARIPTPEQFLGRPLGSAPVRHHELVSYISSIGALSDRLQVEVIGYSHERRPILFVVATSPANHARIDEIRRDHVALTEPELGQDVLPGMPVVTWLNYGVHGAESSGMDAALPTIYYLAAAEGPQVDRLLEGSVILVTAVFNPDGHSNRIAWMDTFGSRKPNANPDHIEHDYDSQLARTNHYGFDLNRQWISVTQPEPCAWMRKWHEWRPNVTVDYHEMGSQETYYFAPGIASRTHPLIPDEGMRLVAEVVGPSEAFMDSQARLYFHGDRYDHFFLGKGAAFPLVNGGVGILHEASAARGIELETVNGIRTYRENILKHFRTSIANAEGALANRDDLLRFQKRFYDASADRARNHPVKAYVFAAPGDDARLHHFVELLNFHRIRVYELGRDITEGGITYRGGEAMIVPLDQPQHVLIRALFETITEFQDTKFYDVSTWTLPLSFGMQYAPLAGRRIGSDLVGIAAGTAMPVAGPPDEAPYAYAFEWTGYYAPRALYRILDAGLLARVALNPFVGETTRGPLGFQRGSVVVGFDRQPVARERIHEIMRDIARGDGVVVHSLVSGRSAVGTAGPDIGGQFYRPLSKPVVLLVVGRDMDWYNAGEVWHLLDQRMSIDVTLRDRSRLGNADLGRYTHIVLAGGNYRSFPEREATRLREWVEQGGTIVGIRQGAHWVRDNVLEGTSEEPGTTADVSGHEGFADEAAETARYPYEEKELRDPIDVIGGAIFAGDLDNTHPLGFGYVTREIALHRNTTEVFKRPDNPYATVIAYATPPLLSGYASEQNQSEIEGSAALIAERKGSGSVILFADDPNFRAIWYGTNKLFLNALFFSKAFEPPRRD
ncbi:MAG: M14 family zinc carboxypeptidase [Gammaproteobacteria bacterium]|nr:M14 family zinc carboxypeptidase [Gammaproteobacteria bacterium]MDH4253520.1 M14 family zinc carboxypeptidase [Gammaproteobacteria bacterium]